MDSDRKLILLDITDETLLIEDNDTLEEIEVYIENSTYEHVKIFLYNLPSLKKNKMSSFSQ